MNPLMIGVIAFVVLIVFMLLRVPIGMSMFVVGFCGLLIFNGVRVAEYAFTTTPYNAIFSFSLTAIPMFILLGNLANEAGVTTELYDIGNKVLGRLPGGLGIATVFTCAGFAATTGSSVGMVAAMTRIALPEMDRYGYKRSISLGTIAGAGTLGILIPPSIPMVIYAINTEQSVGSMLMGGIIPGVIMAVCMCLYLVVRCALNPSLAPRREERYSLLEILKSLKGLWSIVLLFGSVLGAIYLGWATATEAAGIGCLVALVVAAVKKRLSFASIKRAFIDTIKTTCMIMLISIGAAIFQLFLTRCGFATEFANLFINAHLPTMAMIVVLLLIYIPLGMFFDTMGMILLTVPIFYPILSAAGVNPIWFGIMVVMMIQISLLSPPVGLNVYVLKGCVKDSSLSDIFRAAIPWMLIQLIVVAIVLLIPQTVTWLPGLMK